LNGACYDFKVFTRVLRQLMTKFAPLTCVFRCPTCKQGQYAESIWTHLKVGIQCVLFLLGLFVMFFITRGQRLPDLNPRSSDSQPDDAMTTKAITTPNLHIKVTYNKAGYISQGPPCFSLLSTLEFQKNVLSVKHDI